MKTSLFGLLVAATAYCSSAQAVDVGVSIQVAQPGVYGRIDIGRFPQPQVVVAQPLVIVPPVLVEQTQPEPVYMWVPPGHRKKWGKYCSRYGACGVPVYFVQQTWYDTHVRGKDQSKHKYKHKEHGNRQGSGKHEH